MPKKYYYQSILIISLINKVFSNLLLKYLISILFYLKDIFAFDLC